MRLRPAAGVLREPSRAPLQPLTADALAERIEQLRGRVILVDFWASWCAPCRRALPHLVQLMPDEKELAVITVALDNPPDLQDASALLQEAHAELATQPGARQAECYVSPYGASPQSYDEFEITRRAVPHLRLYDRSGQLRYRYTGIPDDLAARVGELLAEP